MIASWQSEFNSIICWAAYKNKNKNRDYLNCEPQKYHVPPAITTCALNISKLIVVILDLILTLPFVAALWWLSQSLPQQQTEKKSSFKLKDTRKMEALSAFLHATLKSKEHHTPEQLRFRSVSFSVSGQRLNTSAQPKHKYSSRSSRLHRCLSLTQLLAGGQNTSNIQDMRINISNNGTRFCKIHTYWNVLNYSPCTTWSSIHSQIFYKIYLHTVNILPLQCSTNE